MKPVLVAGLVLPMLSGCFSDPKPTHRGRPETPRVEVPTGKELAAIDSYDGWVDSTDRALRANLLTLQDLDWTISEEAVAWSRQMDEELDETQDRWVHTLDMFDGMSESMKQKVFRENRKLPAHLWSARRKLFDAAKNPKADVRTSIHESLDAAQDLVAQMENTLQEASRSMNGMGG